MLTVHGMTWHILTIPLEMDAVPKLCWNVLVFKLVPLAVFIRFCRGLDYGPVQVHWPLYAWQLLPLSSPLASTAWAWPSYVMLTGGHADWALYSAHHIAHLFTA